MRTITTAIACTALMACIACGKNDGPASTAGEQNNNGASASDTPAARNDTSTQPQAQQVTYEGCVQKGAGLMGGDYLLTMLNEPPGTAGTTGSATQSGSTIEREELRMAAQSYRLDPMDGVKLDDMVGKQVRVSGRISEQAKLPQHTDPGDPTLQRPTRDDEKRSDQRTRLNTTDLAKLDVTSATVIGDSCGSLGRETSGRTTPEMAGTDRSPRVRR